MRGLMELLATDGAGPSGETAVDMRGRAFSAGRVESAALPVCTVGYALNAKKLRGSAAGLPSSDAAALSRGLTSSSTAVDTTAHDESSPAQARPSRDSANTDNSGRKRKIWRGGGLADILVSSAEDEDEMLSVKFVAWDPDADPAAQPSVHVLIHKLTEDIEREAQGVLSGGESEEDTSSDRSRGPPRRLEALRRYLAHHGQTVLVDPLPAVRLVTSRGRTVQQLRAIQDRLGRASPFSQPDFLILDALPAHSPAQVAQLMTQQNLKFPVICKPLEACGTAVSHSMVHTYAYSVYMHICSLYQNLSIYPHPCLSVSLSLFTSSLTSPV